MKKFELPQMRISEFDGEILTASSLNPAMEMAKRDAKEFEDSLGTVSIYMNMGE